MKAQMFTIAGAVALFTATSFAASNRIVGVIAGVEMQSSPTLQITSKGAGGATVRTDDKTAYMKWVTHKPWQGGDRVGANALVQGRCVEVELADNNVAKVVRVSDEPAGSVFDPCKGRR